MTDLRADFDVLASGDSSLSQINEAARDGLARLRREVDALLSSGWHGGAAAGFAHGWQQWHHAAEGLFAELSTLSLALRVSGEEYACTDDAIARTAAVLR